MRGTSPFSNQMAYTKKIMPPIQNRMRTPVCRDKRHRFACRCTKLWLEITRPGRCCRVVRQHDPHFLHTSGIWHRLRRVHGGLVRHSVGGGKTQTVKRSSAAFGMPSSTPQKMLREIGTSQMNEFEKRADKVGDWAARVLICVGFFSLLLVVAIAVGRTVMSDVLAWFIPTQSDRCF